MKVRTDRIGDAGLNDNANDNRNASVEYLSELQGRDGSIKYRQMSKDPIVGMILRVHKNPIRSASWDIPMPADATDYEKKAIEIIKGALFGDSGTEFDTLLNKALTMVEYGYSCFEQYYKPTKIGGNVYLLPVLEQRMQTSIQDIIPKDQIVNQVCIGKGMTTIPFDALVFFVLNQQGDDMRGESMLRNCYRPWKDKRTFKEWQGIGIQRSISGIPSMTIPKGIMPTDKRYIAAEILLQNICQHENAYMILEDGWKLDIHESKFNPDPVQKVIDACSTEMALSVLAQFVMLGQMQNGGAFALSRDQSDFFLDGLNYIVNLICAGFNSRVIRPFVKLNFGDKIDPKRIALQGTNLNKKAGKELSEVLTTLKGSGFMKPTVDDEIMLRSQLEMPALTDEELEARRAQDMNPEPAPKVNDKKDEDDPDQAEIDLKKKGAVKLSETTDAKSRREYIANTEKEMLDFMRGNLLLSKDKLLADLEATLKRGSIEIQGLKNLEIPTAKYLKGLQMKLAGIATDSWSRAKKQAKLKNVKFADADPKDVTDKTLRQYVLNQAQSISDKQAAAMLNRAILTASNNSLKGFSVAQTVSNTSKAIDDYINSSAVQVDGSLIVVGTANFGESQFYKEVEDQLWGYEFVGIDDDVQTDICRWYNGKTFSVNSPELAQATPPLHANCRSYMRPIYKSEEQPEINDVVAPPSVMAGKTIF